MAVSVLFCGDPLDPPAVDSQFRREADFASGAGRIGVVDHGALLAGEVEAAVGRVPAGLGPVWYRGRTISAASYAALDVALRRRGVQLVVPAEMYRRGHELPGWHDIFATATPRSVWLPGPLGRIPSVAEVAELVAPLGGGPGIVNDYGTSRSWDGADAGEIPDLSKPVAVHQVVARFLQWQQSDLDGGIVIRRAERFVDAGEDRGRARVWWLDGHSMLIGPHPDTPDEYPEPDLTQVWPLVEDLGCPFITTDVARGWNGQWRVVKVDDGQVSKFPATLHPADLLLPMQSRHRPRYTDTWERRPSP